MGLQSEHSYNTGSRSKTTSKMKLFFLAIFLIAGALAEPVAESKPEGKSDADAWYYYNLHGYWPTWYTGYHYLGKRSADAKAEPEGKSEADAEAWYALYGYWPAWYTGYYGHYLGKRSADAKPEGKFDADAWLYYTTYGYWPVWYTGYHGYYGHYL